MLLGPSDRCNRPAGCPKDGCSLPRAWCRTTDLQSCRGRTVRQKASAATRWESIHLARTAQRPPFSSSLSSWFFFSVFALAFRATFFAPFFLRAGTGRFPRLAFFDFVFLRFLAMIILRYFNCNRCEPLGHGIRSRKPDAGRVRQAAREAGRRSPNRLIRLYARWGRSCQPRVV